jgi:hypothetical protein
MTNPDVPSTAVLEPEQAFWGSPLRPAGCPACQHAFLIPAARLGQICPNCARGILAAQPAVLVDQPPELLVPFAISPQALLSVYQAFVRPVRFRPGDFTPEKLLERCVPVYLPMWMVDSTMTANWSAEIGFNYQVKTTQESYEGGRWITKEKVENRIRYEPRLGQIRRRYNNITTSAVSDHARMMQRTGRYDLKKAAAFDSAQLHHSILRVPDIPPESAWPAARESLEARAASDCAVASGGQHVRSCQLQASYTQLNWTQLFLPLFSTYYTTDEGQRFPIFINGQTGAISGVRMASQRKSWQWTGILAGTAALLLVLGLLSFAAVALLPPLTILGGFLVFLSFVTGAAAAFPVLWTWQWNRKQPPE